MSDTTTAEPVAADLIEEAPVGSREIAHRNQAGAVATADAASFTATTMMAMVRELALDERIDAAKLETVMRVANQQQDREREIQFRQDKNRAVRQMPLIRKDGRIVILDKNHPENMDLARTQGHFEKWADVQAAITPVLDANNLTLTHKVDHADGQTIVIAVLTHDNGYLEESGPMRLPLDTSGGKNNVQGAGSSQTYGMRYTARAICGLRLVGGQGEDDGHLIALRDEPLNDQQQKRLTEAEAAFARGPQAYEEWFGQIPPMDRAWMINTGRHAEFGGSGPLGLAKPENTPADAPAPSATEEPAKRKREPTMTPEQWVEGYERQCRECGSLDDLVALQTREAKPLAALKDKHPELHRRTSTAGSDAYARLSSASDDQTGGEEG